MNSRDKNRLIKIMRMAHSDKQGEIDAAVHAIERFFAEISGKSSAQELEAARLKAEEHGRNLEREARRKLLQEQSDQARKSADEQINQARKAGYEAGYADGFSRGAAATEEAFQTVRPTGHGSRTFEVVRPPRESMPRKRMFPLLTLKGRGDA